MRPPKQRADPVPRRRCGARATLARSAATRARSGPRSTPETSSGAALARIRSARARASSRGLTAPVVLTPSVLTTSIGRLRRRSRDSIDAHCLIGTRHRRAQVDLERVEAAGPQAIEHRAEVRVDEPWAGRRVDALEHVRLNDEQAPGRLRGDRVEALRDEPPSTLRLGRPEPPAEPADERGRAAGRRRGLRGGGAGGSAAGASAVGGGVDASPPIVSPSRSLTSLAAATSEASAPASNTSSRTPGFVRSRSSTTSSHSRRSTSHSQCPSRAPYQNDTPSSVRAETTSDASTHCVEQRRWHRRSGSAASSRPRPAPGARRRSVGA